MRGAIIVTFAAVNRENTVFKLYNVTVNHDHLECSHIEFFDFSRAMKRVDIYDHILALQSYRGLFSRKASVHHYTDEKHGPDSLDGHR